MRRLYFSNLCRKYLNDVHLRVPLGLRRQRNRRNVVAPAADLLGPPESKRYLTFGSMSVVCGSIVNIALQTIKEGSGRRRAIVGCRPGPDDAR